MTPKKKILFLCTGNSCRSQMAEGWLSHLRSDDYQSLSAGVEPHGMNPLAVRAMSEVGIDISAQSSDHIDIYLDAGLDYVFTVCDNARETCPIFPGDAKVIHLGFDDPPRLAKAAQNEEEAMGHYRRVRDEISQFIEKIDPLLY